ncbi:hypothetical protein AB0N87_07775 [Streptomyces sp. NPDC093228]|uniref:hypothetical protein n=1 Tax=Streptomyces sp. NPDC093228 TaxID=3155070 RepID=UPI00341ECA0B
MSDEFDNTQTSEEPLDGAATTEPADPAEDALGDAGKRALAALRSEIKELKAQIKAQEADDDATRDAGDDDGAPSEGTRDAAADEPTPQRPRFEGTADGGAMRTPSRYARQLSRDELTGMSPAAIEKARRNGQLRNLLSGK